MSISGCLKSLTQQSSGDSDGHPVLDGSGPAAPLYGDLTRREMLLQTGGGFGGIALAALLAKDACGAQLTAGHHPATARQVIFLFMEGGPSHLDTFDPKPKLNELAGQPLPPGFKRVITAMGEVESPLLASRRKWSQHGECGTWVSDWLPHTARHVDDLAVIRSCVTDAINHSGGVCQMNTCVPLGGRPSLGAWVSYGLGTENENLPAFVVMTDRAAAPVNGPRNWSAGFMPAGYQGTRLGRGDVPIANLEPAYAIPTGRQQAKRAYLQRLNERHAASRRWQSELEARIASFELAFRMQSYAPQAVDLSRESPSTHAAYGLQDNDVDEEGRAFRRNCLLARRLVERGVRFVQLYSGSGSKWDAHSGIEKNHSRLCKQVDKPVAALLADLKQRGLLDETLVIWGGEFGRTPMSEKGDGRDHNPTGFTMWMAGGGVRGGQVLGATDELGFHAVENRLHVRDLHATILYLLGIDHMQLVYRHKGRPERPTVNEGVVAREVGGWR